MGLNSLKRWYSKLAGKWVRIWKELEEVNIVKTHCQKFSQNLYATRCIIKEGIWKAKKHLKRISTSLAIRKERSKHVLPLLHISVAKANITDQNKVQVGRWRHCGLLMGAQTGAASLEYSLKVS